MSTLPRKNPQRTPDPTGPLTARLAIISGQQRAAYKITPSLAKSINQLALKHGKILTSAPCKECGKKRQPQHTDPASGAEQI